MNLADGTRIEIVSFDDGEFAIAEITPFSTCLLVLEAFEKKTVSKIFGGNLISRTSEKYTWVSLTEGVTKMSGETKTCDYTRVKKIYDAIDRELNFSVVNDNKALLGSRVLVKMLDESNNLRGGY